MPDSRRIVFTSNRANGTNWDIYAMNVNATGLVRLNSAAGLDTEPVFSPNGSKIAFATERFAGNLDIAVMDANGQNVRRLTTSGQEDIEPAWRPNGQQIAFARVLGSGEVITTERRPFSPPYGNVHRIRVSDGADLGDLTGDLDFGAGDPFWQRGGSLIAFFKSAAPFLPSPPQLWVMNQNGGGEFHIPGEASANIHPAIGVGVDDDRDGTPNYLESGSVGRAALAPRRIKAGRTVRVRCAWTHPRRWRRLDTMWLRLSQGRWLRGMVRFSMRHRRFSLFDGLTDQYTRSRRAGRGRLRSSLMRLDLRRSRVVGVNRKKVRLVLALRFPRRLAGGVFRVRVQANDRRG